MKVAEFEKCFIGIPMKDGETREEIEDRFISALESVNEDCFNAERSVMKWTWK